MKSDNHQYLEFSDDIKARYVRTTLQPITGFRLNPRNSVNPNERITFVLATPEDNVDITPWEEGVPTQVKQTKFTYEDEVLELYTDLEVKAFERMNRLLVENGILVPYDEQAPDISKVNTLSAQEIQKLVNMKQLTPFKSRVDELTSISALEALLHALQENDSVKYSYVKYVSDKIDELRRSKDTTTNRTY